MRFCDRLRKEKCPASLGEHEFSKIPTIPAEIRTSPFAMSSLLSWEQNYGVNKRTSHQLIMAAGRN
jgi:hypothetical protein